jgi:hypothetical protein
MKRSTVKLIVQALLTIGCCIGLLLTIAAIVLPVCFAGALMLCVCASLFLLTDKL